MFDAGCGVLAFINAVRTNIPTIQCAGMDGAPGVVTQLKTELCPKLGLDPDMFHCGLLPSGMASVASGEFDVCVCHSVFQYLSHEDAAASVREMLRIVKPGGLVLIADICDEKTKEVQEKFSKCVFLYKYMRMWLCAHHRTFAYTVEEHFAREAISYGETLPRHTYYPKEWFDQFCTEGSGVSNYIRHVKTKGYVRRHHRYCVYLRKDL